MARTLGALGALLTLVAGCNGLDWGGPRGVAPQSRREALDRVNENLGRINRPLGCRGLVSFRFTDADGRPRAYIGHDARLLFRPPQSLLFDVQSLAGTVAQIGSNDEYYWVWIEPEVRKLWYGLWADARGRVGRDLPVPPDQVLDALMLRPLSETLDDGILPLLRVVGDDHRLIYVRFGPDRQPRGAREIRLDPHPPYQPLEIVDRLPDGQIVMHAELRQYESVGPDGPRTARRYVVRWPANRAEMRLDIVSAKFRDDLPADAFDFPAGWQGEIERVDAVGPDEAGAATGRGS